MKIYRVTYEELDTTNSIKGYKKQTAQYQLSDEELRVMDGYGLFTKAALRNDIRTRIIEELKQKIYE